MLRGRCLQSACHSCYRSVVSRRRQSYRTQLCICGQAPVVIAAVVLLCFLAFPFVKRLFALEYCWYRRGNPKGMLLAALPWLLLLVFVVSPMVSSAAFRAFSCEEFEDG